MQDPGSGVRAWATLLGLAACNCGQPVEAPPPTPPATVQQPHPRAAAVAAMEADEEARFSAHDFVGAPTWADASGSNPFLVERVGQDRFVGATRGDGLLLVLDGQGKELAQADATVAGLSGWAWAGPDTLFVVGERDAGVHRFALDGDTLRRTGHWSVAGVHGLRDVALVDGGLLLADRHRSRVLRIDRPRKDAGSVTPTEVARCGGALQLQVVGEIAVANCLLDHTVMIWGLGAQGGRATIQHDGPIWGVAAIATPRGIRLGLGGVENHPLERRGGSFGYIDSFVFVYDVEDWTASKVAELNVGMHGVVTPKWLAWRDEGTLETAGYGSAAAAVIDVATEGVKTVPVPPGITAVAGTLADGLAANPLLDGWTRLSADGARTHAVHPEDPRSPAVRLGEALVFTTLMAPAGSSTGRLSRFTCETCHFEGTVDGRTHHTGRGDVHATTKTLRGLFGNRPHFTRALDRTTSGMIDAEFSVASRGTGADPWFTLDPAEHPWLAELGVRGEQTPPALRRAVFEFLVFFNPDANPATVGRRTFSELERRGAKVFAEHCESCHQARLRADDLESREAVEQWENRVFSGGTLLWAYDERVKTGVEPYVHEQGARVPSLRRLWVKQPYFTNGSARDLDAVLERVDLGPPFSHAAAAERPLSKRKAEALRAFLDLL